MECVVARAPHEDVVTAFAPQGVVARAAVEVVVAMLRCIDIRGIAVEFVVARPAEHDVVAFSAVKCIRAVFAEHDVVALAGIGMVVACPCVDDIRCAVLRIPV